MKPIRILSAIGGISRVFSVLLLLPALVALAYEPWTYGLDGLKLPRNTVVFVASAAIVAMFWVPVYFATRNVHDEDLQDKEAYLTVALGWIVLTLFAMVPFILSRTLTSPFDAFFEAMSGLTTTGATTISGSLEAVPESVMVWRAMLQYLGGMGIIVLSVALLARLTHGGIQLLQAEAPGPSVTRIRPKLAQTAKTLWMVYALFTVILFGILLFLFRFHIGMDAPAAILDALIHTFTTLSTGGFSNHTASIAYYDSWLVEAVLIVFILIGGSNFTLHYHAVHGDWRRLVRDPEWRFFMTIYVVSTLAITGMLWRAAGFTIGALRDAAFTTAAIGTSTGYATADYDAWPDAAKLILIILMFTGATAGSTTGGMKVIRIYLLLKVVKRELRKLLHPRAVIPIRLGGKVIKEEAVMTVVAFFFSFITIWMIGTVLLITTDPIFDLFDGAVAAASMMGNTGPAMGVVGPTDNYAGLMPHSKVILATMMWVGRLEVFTAILLFNPASWRR